MNRENEIHQLLLKLGIRPYQAPYNYISEAVDLVMDKPARSKINIVEDIYKPLGDKYLVTWKAVERAIRLESHKVYKTAHEELLREIFGEFNDRSELVSCKSFITSIAAYLKYNLKVE